MDHASYMLLAKDGVIGKPTPRKPLSVINGNNNVLGTISQPLHSQKINISFSNSLNVTSSNSQHQHLFKLVDIPRGSSSAALVKPALIGGPTRQPLSVIDGNNNVLGTISRPLHSQKINIRSLNSLNVTSSNSQHQHLFKLVGIPRGISSAALPTVKPQIVEEEEVPECLIGEHQNHDVVVVVKNTSSLNVQQDGDLVEARKRAEDAIKCYETSQGTSVMPPIEDVEDEEDFIDVASDSDAHDSDMEENDFDLFNDEDIPSNDGNFSDNSTLSDDFITVRKKNSKSLSLKKNESVTKSDGIRRSREKTQHVGLEIGLQKILPKNYSYVVVSSEVLGGEYNHIHATLRVNITSGEEARKWLDEFELSSNTNFRVMKTWRPKSNNRVIFKKQYRCHNNTLAEKSGTKNPHEKHVKCPAEMMITVNNTNMQWSKDSLLQSHPSKVTLKHLHNHETEHAWGDVLQHRRPSQQVVEAFTGLFKNEKSRITPAQAMDMYLTDLEKTDPDRHSMGDGALCPEMAWVYKLYNKIMKRKNGDPYGPEMISALERNIKEYNEECKDICSKMGSCHDGMNVHHFVVVCSPMMKRILTHHKTAGEVMFIDSSGNMDNCNARIFVILTASVLCGLPEGLLITFSESEKVITAALELWKTILPKNAFFGRAGPKIIMSDDSAALRNSLRSSFPLAILLLCIFHVLQAMWRYIWDSKHLIPFEDKPYMYHLFKQVLYAKTVEEFNALYEEALGDQKMLSYGLLRKHVEDLRPRANEWALCFRVDLLLRGNNTDNLNEAVMRIIKDTILGRTRAYNTVQLFNILIRDLDKYYKRKLALVVNNRVRSVRSKLRVDPQKLKPLVAEKLYSEHLFKVTNAEAHTEYIVDTQLEMCSCPVGKCGAPCKHQLAVVKKFKITHHQFLPKNDPNFKMVLYYIMTGKTNAPEGFFQTLKGDKEAIEPTVSVDTDSTCSTDQVIDSAGDDQQIESETGPQNNVQFQPETVKEKIMEMAEDLCQKVTASHDYLSEPLDKFLHTYWSIVKRSNSDSTLATSLATFGKDQSVLRPPVIGRKRTIHVQPTSLARRVVSGTRGKQALAGGRPRKLVAEASAGDHGYTSKQEKRKSTTPDHPTWFCPPKKPCKVPHSLSQCVDANTRLPK